ncbi:unnamed protein product [Urochloa humidicola]
MQSRHCRLLLKKQENLEQVRNRRPPRRSARGDSGGPSAAAPEPAPPPPPAAAVVAGARRRRDRSRPPTFPSLSLPLPPPATPPSQTLTLGRWSSRSSSSSPAAGVATSPDPTSPSPDPSFPGPEGLLPQAAVVAPSIVVAFVLTVVPRGCAAVPAAPSSCWAPRPPWSLRRGHRLPPLPDLGRRPGRRRHARLGAYGGSSSPSSSRPPPPPWPLAAPSLRAGAALGWRGIPAGVAAAAPPVMAAASCIHPPHPSARAASNGVTALHGAPPSFSISGRWICSRSIVGASQLLHVNGDGGDVGAAQHHQLLATVASVALLLRGNARPWGTLLVAGRHPTRGMVPSSSAVPLGSHSELHRHDCICSPHCNGLPAATLSGVSSCDVWRGFQ